MDSDNAYDSNQQFNEEEEGVEEDENEDGYEDDETITPFFHPSNKANNLKTLDYSHQILHSTFFLNIESNKPVSHQKVKRVIKKCLWIMYHQFAISLNMHPW